MDIVGAELEAYRVPLVGSNARQSWSVREGLLFRLRTRDGRVGQGEASPLPGYSPDDLDACRLVLQSLHLQKLHLQDIATSLEQVPPNLPAARFALETALLDLLGQSLGQSMAALLQARSEPVRTNVLFELGPELLGRAQRWWDAGVRTFKIKVGRHLEQELAELLRLREAFPDLALRLDANQCLTRDVWTSWASQAAALAPEYVEEPMPPELVLRESYFPVPLALDESLRHPSFFPLLEHLLSRGALRTFVLKPMVLGGLLVSLGLATQARTLGLGAVVTHTLDGPVALAAALALANTQVGVHGLAPSPLVDRWGSNYFEISSFSIAGPLGLGLGLPLLSPP